MLTNASSRRATRLNRLPRGGITGQGDLLQLQRRIGSANWCDWHVRRAQMYDWVRLVSAGTNSIAFFNQPQGTPDPISGLVKTLEQTNLQKSRTFGQRYFVLKSIKTHISILPKVRQNAELTGDANMAASMPGAIRLIRNLHQMGVLTLKLGAKEYNTIPMPFRFCPPGFGLAITQLPTATGAVSEWIQQSTNPKDCFNLTPEQMIEPEQTIEATIDFPNGLTPNFAALADTPELDIGLIFDGYLAEPAQ